MTVATVAEAPVFAVLRILKSDLSEEQYCIVKRELVNASLALAKRYWSVHNSHDIELACKVAAGVISLGMREMALLSGREPFYKEHPAPIKTLFQIGWSHLGENVVAPSKREHADETETLTTGASHPPKKMETPVIRFLKEICTIPGAPWHIDNILYKETKRRDEEIILAKLNALRDRLAPIVNDHPAFGEDGYTSEESEKESCRRKAEMEFSLRCESEKEFFLQIIAFGEPKRTLPRKEIMRLKLPLAREAWDARVAEFLAKVNNEDLERWVRERWGLVDKPAFAANVEKAANDLRKAQAQSDFGDITSLLNIEIEESIKELQKSIKQAEKEFESFHENFHEKFVEKLGNKASSKMRKEIETFFDLRKDNLLLHAALQEYDKILELDEGKPRYRKWLERYTRELRK